MVAKQYIKNKIEEWTIEMERQYARYKCEHVTEAVKKFSYGEYTRLNINIDDLEKDLKEIIDKEEEEEGIRIMEELIEQLNEQEGENNE